MHDSGRLAPKPAIPAPSPILTRLHRGHAPTVDPTPDSGADHEKAPGHRLQEIHAEVTARSAQHAAQDLVTPESGYRIVLRCTAADLDH